MIFTDTYKGFHVIWLSYDKHGSNTSRYSLSWLDTAYLQYQELRSETCAAVLYYTSCVFDLNKIQNLSNSIFIIEHNN